MRTRTRTRFASTPYDAIEVFVGDFAGGVYQLWGNFTGKQEHLIIGFDAWVDVLGRWPLARPAIK